MISFEVGGGENVRGIPGACATSNFAYLYLQEAHGLISVREEVIVRCLCGM